MDVARLNNKPTLGRRADEAVTEAAADEVSEEGADTFAELFDEDTEGNIAEVRL